MRTRRKKSFRQWAKIFNSKLGDAYASPWGPGAPRGPFGVIPKSLRMAGNYDWTTHSIWQLGWCHDWPPRRLGRLTVFCQAARKVAQLVPGGQLLGHAPPQSGCPWSEFAEIRPQTLRGVSLTDCLTRPSDVFLTAEKTARSRHFLLLSQIFFSENEDKQKMS